MSAQVSYTPRERFWLWAMGIFGVVIANGAFLYGLLFQPDTMRDAIANPVSAAFIVEAFVVTVALAYFLRRWEATRLPAGWFVVLSLLGSLAFALPVALLWRRRTMGES